MVSIRYFLNERTYFNVPSHWVIGDSRLQFSGATWLVTVNKSLHRRLQACICIWLITSKHDVIPITGSG